MSEINNLLASDIKFPQYVSGNTVNTISGNCLWWTTTKKIIPGEISCQMPDNYIVTGIWHENFPKKAGPHQWGKFHVRCQLLYSYLASDRKFPQVWFLFVVTLSFWKGEIISQWPVNNWIFWPKAYKILFVKIFRARHFLKTGTE